MKLTIMILDIPFIFIYPIFWRPQRYMLNKRNPTIINEWIIFAVNNGKCQIILVGPFNKNGKDNIQLCNSLL